jgi:AcrR family transcriptional regulator
VAENYSEMHLSILDATVALIEQGGESAVRLRAIAQRVGITQPTLYHYFSDRETLIVAAHARRLKVNLATTINPFLAAVRNCTTQEEFLEVLLGVYYHSYQPDRVVVREVRAELIGASIQREKLRIEVINELNSSLAQAVDAIEFAKEQGWLRADIDARAFALFNLSLISSLIYPEIQKDETLISNWKQIAIEAISSVVMNETHTHQ